MAEPRKRGKRKWKHRQKQPSGAWTRRCDASKSWYRGNWWTPQRKMEGCMPFLGADCTTWLVPPWELWLYRGEG